jgi:16S rRNA (guanine527-N7)-methyltransferase
VFLELLKKRLPHLSPEQLEKLAAHYQLLTRWNRVLNLTRITKLEEVLNQHYMESVFLAERLPPGPLSLVDIGSGAGFPGLPVAVARPECRVTVVESQQRKAVFLREAVRGWVNVEVMACRAESVEGRFDWVLVRAVNWRGIEAAAARLAGDAAVLGGSENPGGKLFRWDASVPSPAGSARYLHLGRRVSRETD